MPSAYTITFRRAQSQRSPAPLTPTLKDVHGLACRLLEPPGNPDHYQRLKAFAVGWPEPSDTNPAEFDLRVSDLTFKESAPPQLAAFLGQRYRLGSIDLEGLAVRKHASVSYQALRTPGPLWSCEFRFLTPTYFSRSERDYPLPDPQLIVRSLVERWNAQTADVEELHISEDAARELGRRIILAAHSIRTRAVPSGNGRPRIGFVGSARLGLRPPDRRDPNGIGSARLLATLSAFAPFSGIGAQTTHGLGAVTTTPIRG